MQPPTGIRKCYERIPCPHCGVGCAKTVRARHVEICGRILCREVLLAGGLKAWALNKAANGWAAPAMAAYLKVAPGVLWKYLHGAGIEVNEVISLVKCHNDKQREITEIAMAAAVAVRGNRAVPCLECGIVWDRPFVPGCKPAVAQGQTLCADCLSRERKPADYAQRTIARIMPEPKAWRNY